MKQKTILSSFLTLILLSSVVISCGDGGVKENPEELDVTKLTKDQPETHGTEVKPGDVTLTNPLNAEWINTGKGIYELKCQSCHKLNEERLVGPGWKGVTKKRKPEWIMNMITNVDMMLASDAEAQKLLEQCMVRMPNQNITIDESRKVFEFMRQNDGEK